MRYVHTNLIAADWKALSAFYQTVFGCVPVPPQRDLRGQWLDAMTGIHGAHIVGEHLRLPGYGSDGPTLEIFSYGNEPEAVERSLIKPGFAHIAFEVDDVRVALTRLQQAGGSALGEVVTKQYETLGLATFVYARDIEGNILELQSWQK